MQHPVSPRGSTLFHAGLALYFAAGFTFHLICSLRHLDDWLHGRP